MLLATRSLVRKSDSQPLGAKLAHLHLGFVDLENVLAAKKNGQK